MSQVCKLFDTARVATTEPAAGWTIFDKLYFVNGTFYVVTDNFEEVPERKLMISSGVFIENGKEAELRRLPSDKDMQIIDRDTARKMVGTQAERLDGVTVSTC